MQKFCASIRTSRNRIGCNMSSSCLRHGKVVGMPTDTFYGLAVDPVNLRAVEHIYEIKSRLKHKPLSLLIADVSQAYELSREVGPHLDMLAERFWPGPLTLIVKASSRLPLRSTAKTGQRGAAGSGCGDSAGGGGGLRAADYGDVGESAGLSGVHVRGVRARPDWRPDSADRGRRADGADPADDDCRSFGTTRVVADTARGLDSDA